MSTVVKKAASTPGGTKSGSATKSAAGCVLSQKGVSKALSPQKARIAVKVLANPSSDKAAKSSAASSLSQKDLPFPVKAYRVAGGSLTQKKSAEIIRKFASKKST